MTSLFSKGEDGRFNFHNDQTLHGPPSDRAWYSNVGGDAVAALKGLIHYPFVGKTTAARDVAAELDIDDPLSRAITQKMVTELWGSMLHPPLSYHGNKFRFRTADGSYNNIMYPDLGKAGSPYAKTVQPTRARHGAKPDPGDIFDLLLARNEKSVESPSGMSSFLLYHASLIIHDIFRTDDEDANKSVTSSYLELSPLYGSNQQEQLEVRQMKLGLLKPDTFAEERLLRQPPGVCLYIVMYNRFHNYVAKQLLEINENGRFSLPRPAKEIVGQELDDWRSNAIKQQDEDLFQTARLVTCGFYMQISVHDYLRCLMGLHPKNTAWTLDPNRSYPAENDKHGLQRGEGNMVSAEFNLLYRFHGPISNRDAKWAEGLMVGLLRMGNIIDDNATEEQMAKGERITTKMAIDGEIPLHSLQKMFGELKDKQASMPPKMGRPWFPETLDPVGDPEYGGWFRRDEHGYFDDAQMAAELTRAIEDPIVHFGGNIPKVLKAIEILGILQARKWEMTSLNEFREFFGMSRHNDFADMNSDPDIQNRLRDLYEDPDMVELYPGVMLEGNGQNIDPGTSCPGGDSALWRAIFSDAVTLIRSDRFYTIDWNVDSYTAWGFNEVQSDPKVNKGSIINQLFARALPDYFEYNSLHLWQPFYTPTMNAILAEQQGYINQLDLSGLEDQLGAPWVVENGHVPLGFFSQACSSDVKETPRKIRRTMAIRDSWFDLEWRGNEAAPRPKAPVTIADYDVIKEILDGTTAPDWAKLSEIEPGDISHETLRAIIAGDWAPQSVADGIIRKSLPSDWGKSVSQYFDGLANNIRLREQRKFQKKANGDQIYQIDVVKDFAIPLITRFFADFLGFWESIKTEQHLERPYDENDIYLHLSNCQRFSSQDSDPARLWKLRHAFKESLQFLIKLTKKGVARYQTTILGKGVIGSYILQLERAVTGDPDYVQNVRRLGASLVHALSGQGGFSTQQIAAILLAQVLGTGVSTVTTFTEALAYFIDPKSRKNKSVDQDGPTEQWRKLQDIVWADSKLNEAGTRVIVKDDVYDDVERYALEAQRFHEVQLLRIFSPKDEKVKAVQLKSTKIVDGKVIEEMVDVSVGDTIVLDISSQSYPEQNDFILGRPQGYYLNLGSYDGPRRPGIIGQELSIIALTCLLKSTAQWKNLRVAHDKLGRLRRVHTPDGLVRYTDVQWGELLPSPVTWNLRFDGLGKGVFTGGDNADSGHRMDQVWQRRKLPADSPIRSVLPDAYQSVGMS
ncbi:heme peroxidase [Microthyrium microscopicum]|uniref:Heme peroxidase n=1 Tax=Microthyrium microscopicum TaxID=703497 RepID=A0A6A6U9T7_9PEZI|nr:heme peroxidase [Microthyrium microscopicum]